MEWVRKVKVFLASLKGVSPYSQSRMHNAPKLEKEGHRAYEERTWRERCHAQVDGSLFIPPMCFKEALAAAAKYLSVPIPGKGKQTYTKHFLSGVLVAEGLPLPITKDAVEGEWINLNADGRKGGKTRVSRCMPRIPLWAGDVAFHILDETLTMDVFRYHLEQAGSFIGIGRFRPQNGGYYGRFMVNKVAEVTP